MAALGDNPTELSSGFAAGHDVWPGGQTPLMHESENHRFLAVCVLSSILGRSKETYINLAAVMKVYLS